MYRSIDAVGMAIASAKAPDGAVMRDRLRFVPFFEAAERYVHEHGLIVGGDTATHMLLGHAPGPSDYFYELYSSRAYDDARALTTIFYELAPDGLGHYANMVTGVPRKEFSINVDVRPLFRVKALEIHRGARAADIIVPSTRPANFARDAEGKPLLLQCMGPEIQLMGVYAALTNPASAGEWSALLAVEERLREMYAEEIRGKIKEIGNVAQDGGAELPASTLVAVLINEYVPRSGHAAVGGYAARALSLGDALPPRAGSINPRLQLVTSNSFGDEERAVARIATRLGYNVQSTKNEPKVPTDDRLQRMTMYIVRPGERREPFLDVYNSGEYELVPVARAAGAPKRGGRQRARRGPQKMSVKMRDLPKGAPIGTPFVVMRFLLVDAWTIQLLHRMGFTSAQYTRQVLRELLDDFERVVAAYLRLREAGHFEEIFPTESDSYVGSFVDPHPIPEAPEVRAGGSCEAAGRAGETHLLSTFLPGPRRGVEEVDSK